jgi:hypothetical protein
VKSGSDLSTLLALELTWCHAPINYCVDNSSSMMPCTLDQKLIRARIQENFRWIITGLAELEQNTILYHRTRHSTELALMQLAALWTDRSQFSSGLSILASIRTMQAPFSFQLLVPKHFILISKNYIWMGANKSLAKLGTCVTLFSSWSRTHFNFSFQAR